VVVVAAGKRHAASHRHVNLVKTDRTGVRHSNRRKGYSTEKKGAVQFYEVSC
jgi:hypothetical protein